MNQATLHLRPQTITRTTIHKAIIRQKITHRTRKLELTAMSWEMLESSSLAFFEIQELPRFKLLTLVSAFSIPSFSRLRSIPLRYSLISRSPLSDWSGGSLKAGTHKESTWRQKCSCCPKRAKSVSSRYSRCSNVISRKRKVNISLYYFILKTILKYY